MEQFQITVTKQSRALIALLTFSLSLPFALYLTLAIESIALKAIAALLSIVAINAVAIYSAYGILTIVAKDDKLIFTWTKKIIFNFSPIADVNLKDIKKIVLGKNEDNPFDGQQFLKKIITSDTSINLGTSKYWKRDADGFIWYLKSHTNAIIMDSWDVWKEKGMLNIAYGITCILLLAGAGLVIWIIADNGIDKIETRFWLTFIPSYTAMASYWLVMKRKYNKTGGNNRIKQGL